MIAILDVDMVQQLLWSSEHRKKKVASPSDRSSSPTPRLTPLSLPSLCPSARVQVRDAQAGKTAEAPSRASLEGQFAPGRWLFGVTADAGAALRSTPKVRVG